MTWPTKDDFVDGDVLTAAQVNNIGTNLNLFDPTGITAGYVLTADGAGSVNWAGAGGTVVQAKQATLTSGNVTTSTGSEVASGLSITITPTSVANKLFLVTSINFVITMTSSTNQNRARIRIKDNTASTYPAQALFGTVNANVPNGATTYHTPNMAVQYTPPNTNARTFTVVFDSINAGLYNVTLNATSGEPAFFSIYEVAYS